MEEVVAKRHNAAGVGYIFVILIGILLVIGGSRYGNVSHYGKMEISVHGQVYKYNNIAQIKRAQDRLLELNKQAIDSLNHPEQPVEEKPVEDPFSV